MCMLLLGHHNAGLSHDINVGNRFFEYMAQFKYLGSTVINQYLIQDEIKTIILPVV
jgi:hypothetical protein